MYRKPASPGVLSGVPSGPYAGGSKLVDAAKLPRAARQRLADVLTGRTEPIPILHEHPRGLASRFRATYAASLAVFGLTSLIAIGFADPNAAWAYQPNELVVGYALSSMLLAFSLLSLYRRRAKASGGALVPGRYLLPLDVVEVSPEDGPGDQVVVVTPLGDARDARLRSAGRTRERELALTFENGSELVFALRTESEGEHALRRLERSQALLEELTYSHERDKALADDAFFDLRIDASWSSFAPPGVRADARPRGRWRRRALLHGSLATACALLLGAAFGWVAFVGRGWACDRALYLRALRIGTAGSVDAYLVRATSYRPEAIAIRQRFGDSRAELARPAATPAEAPARGGSAEGCIASLRVSKARAIMVGLIARAQRTGDPVIPVRIETRLGTRPSGVPEPDHVARAAQTIGTFARTFAVTCPASVVRFVVQEEATADVGTLGTPGLDVKIEITWPAAPTWKQPGLAIHAPTIAFDVALHGEAINDIASFRVTVPPPEVPPTMATGGEVVPLLTARAFERLDDELRRGFFGGR